MLTRVGIDWDNDGFINWGATAPLNLVPSAGRAHPMMWYDPVSSIGDLSANLKYAPAVGGVNEYGAIGRKWAANVDGVSKLYVGLKRWGTFQPVVLPYTNIAYHNGDMSLANSTATTPLAHMTKWGTGVLPTGFGLVIGQSGTNYSTNNPLAEGFTVTPLSSYVFGVVMVYPKSKANARSVPELIRVVGNHTTGGNITAIGAMEERTVDDLLVYDRYIYTVMAPASCTKMSFYVNKNIDVSTDSVSVLYLTGFFLVSSSHSNEFYDGQYKFLSPDFSYVGSSGTHTVSFYIRRTDGTAAKTITVTPTRYTIGASTITTSTSFNRDITDDWKKISYSFSLTNQAPVLEVTTASGSEEFEIRGFSVVAGGSSGEFNTGSLSLYDQLDPISVSCDAGMREGMPEEGKADIVLDNVTKLYSPNYEASPLYGYLKKNLRCEIQVYTEGAWRTIWKGWTDTFSVDAGLYQSQQAKITCVQGVFRLRDSEPITNRYEGMRSDEVVRDIIDRSGWWPASSATLTTIGNTAIIGENTYVLDTAETFSAMDTGVLEYEFAGLGWGETSTIESILKDIIKGEQSMLWLERSGKLRYANRNYWLSQLSSAVNLSLDTEVQRATYNYGADVKNRIKGFVNPKQEGDEQDIWKTTRPTPIAKYRIVDIPMNFQYEDGAPATVTEVNPEVTYTVTTRHKQYRKSADVAGEVTGADKERITVKVVEDGRGGRLLRIQNKWWVGVYVEATVRGKLMARTDNETWVFSNDQAIADANAVYVAKLDSKLMATEEHARGAAEVILAKDAIADGEYSEIMIRVTDSNETYIRQLQIGSVVAVTESMADESNKYHGVVGEKFTIANGHIQVDYRLTRIPDTRYAVVGTSTLRPPTINLLPQKTTHFGVAKIVDYPDYTNFWMYKGAVLLSHYDGQVLYNEDYPFPDSKELADNVGTVLIGGRAQFGMTSNPLPFFSSAPLLGLQTKSGAHIMSTFDQAASRKVDYDGKTFSDTLLASYSLGSVFNSLSNISINTAGTYGIAPYGGTLGTMSTGYFANSGEVAWLPAGTYRLSIWYRTKIGTPTLHLVNLASSSIASARLGGLTMSASATFTKATTTITTATLTAPYLILVGDATLQTDVDVIGWSLTEGTVDYTNFDDTMVSHSNSSVVYA